MPEPVTPPTVDQSGVRRRVFTTVATIALGQGLTSLIQVIAVPTLLLAWGEQLYGEWLILFAVPAYLSLSDLGFANVAGNEMTMLAARGQHKSASDLFRSITNLIIFSTAALGLVIVSACWLLPVREWFSLEELSRTETRWVLLILACQVVITLQSGVLEAGFRAGGRYPRGAACRQCVRVSESLSVPVAASVGLSPAWAALAFLAVTIIGTSASWLVLRLTVGWLTFRLGRVEMRRVRPLIRPALAYAAIPFGNAVSVQGMVLVVGAVAGPVAVVTFQTARTLSRLPQGLMNAINQSVWPEVSAAFGAGQIALARSLHRRACQGSLVLTIVIVAVLLPLGPLIIEGWTGGKVDVSYALFAALLLVVGANSLWFTSSVVLVSTNRHQRMAMLYLGGSILALGLAAALVKPFGPRGAGFSLLVIDVMMAAYVLPHSLRLVDDRMRPFVRAMTHIPWFRRQSPTPPASETAGD